MYGSGIDCELTEILSEEHGVFLVRDPQTGEQFVKKELQIYNALVYRQLLRHPVPHTPRIYELQEKDNVLTVIEEYIPGKSLEEILEENGPVPAGQTAVWISELCDILIILHSLQPPVIHRDIKPSNIIITPDGHVVLLDFNAARRYAAAKREDTELLGTKGYAAPEQYGFGESSARTDIYAAGMLMKEMLTGTLDPARPAIGTFGWIIRTCTRLEPEERFQSAVELKSALSDAVPGMLTSSYEHSLSGQRTAPHLAASDFQSPPGKESPAWKKYLPPGFRSGKIGHMFGGACLYALILYSAFTITFESTPPGFLWLERFWFGIGAMLITFFSGNYLHVQGPLQKIPPRLSWLRIVLVCAADLVIFFLAAGACGIIEALFGAAAR